MSRIRRFSDNRLSALVSVQNAEQGRGGQIKWSQLSEQFLRGAFVVQMSAAVLANVTALPVDPIPEAIPEHATFEIGGVKVKLTDSVLAGATSLPVEAVSGAIADNATGYWSNDRTFRYFVPAFTVMVRDSADLLVPRASRAGLEEATEILATDADGESRSDSNSGYGTWVGGIFYENLMPDSDASGDLLSAYKTELRANANGIMFTDFSDDRT